MADAKAKAARAKKHLHDLRQELWRFRKSKPLSVRTEHHPNKGGYLLHVKIRRIPTRVALILGDFLYCTRSALDQLVWSLAHLTIPYPEHTYFPILDRNNADNRHTFARYTTGVPPEATRIIETLQPYNRGTTEEAIHSDPLWRLNALCVIDKHRRIPIHGDESILVFPNLPRSLAPHITRVRHNVVHIPAATKRQVRLDPKASFRAVFGDLSQGFATDLEDLQKIHRFVAEDVLPRFSPFFK
jgi:hypothetical protein